MERMIFRVESLSKSLDKSRTDVDAILQQIVDLRTEIDASQHRLMAVDGDQQQQQPTAAVPGSEQPIPVRTEAEIRLPHSLILCAIRRESPQVSQLRLRNRALRHHLNEYQSALELIMNKYRNNITELLQESQKYATKIVDQHENGERRRAQTETIQLTIELQHMVETFNQMIAPVNEQMLLEQRQLIHQLSLENKGLRQLYRISKEFGSLMAAAAAADDDDDPGSPISVTAKENHVLPS